MLPIEPAFKVFTDRNGKPLENGYIYFGLPNQNPITSPTPVYWDAAGTQPAPQPLRTVNGYIVRSGTPANVFIDVAYSQLVQDKSKRQVFYARNSLDFSVNDSISTIITAFITSLFASTGANLVGFIQAGFGAVKRTLQDKGRDFIDAKDFGATGLGVADDADEILAALAYAESVNKTLRLSGGVYLCSKDIILHPGTSIHGDGMTSSQLKFTGTAAMKSARVVCDYVDVRDLTIQQAGTGLIGLDIGTVRRSVFQNIRVYEYLVGVNLDIGVSLTANYWNRLINVEAAGPGKTLENSVGFNLGNNVNATYPDTDYNVLIGCKSFTCQTGVRMLNAIGCQVIGHQCTEVSQGLSLFSGNNNTIQMMVENSTALGFADVNTRANSIEIYNDGGNATPFQDNGLNYMGGQLFDWPVFANAMRQGDGWLKDRIFFGAVVPSQPLFTLNMNGDSASAEVTLAWTGENAGVKVLNGVGTWNIFKPSVGGTPIVVLSKMLGASGGTASFATNLMTVVTGAVAVGQTITAAGVPTGTTITSFNFGGGGVGTECVLSQTVGTLATRPVVAVDTTITVSAAAGGLVTFTATGHATAVTKLNTLVDIQGISGLSLYPYSRAITYKRLIN